MRRYHSDTPWGAWLITILIVGFVIGAVGYHLTRQQEMLDACMADGHPEYQCYGLIE